MSIYFIHAIGWRTDNDIVFLRIAKRADEQINALIAAIAEQDIFCRNSFDHTKFSFQFPLQRIRITVVPPGERRAKTVLVRIEVDPCLSGEFTSRRRVGLEFFYVLANESI